jgi:uncharacterized protein
MQHQTFGGHKMRKYYLFSIISLLTTFGSCDAATPLVPKLTINGSVVLHKPADQVSFTIQVQTQAETADEALGDNNIKMHTLVIGLQEAGLEKGEYHTGQFSIQPVLTPYPRNPPSDWQPKIIGYQVINSLSIQTPKLELTPLLIDTAGKAGATQIAGITFGIKDPLLYRSEAISAAAANAVRDATTLADAANARLIRVLDISLDQPRITPRHGPEMNMMAKSADSLPYIEPGNVDISANVSIVYEIASK